MSQLETFQLEEDMSNASQMGQPSQTQAAEESSSSSDTQASDVSMGKIVDTGSMIKGATMDHVEVSTDAKTPTTKGQKVDPKSLTKLVSIKGVGPAILTLDDLRGFASRCSAAGCRKPKKVQVCDAIAEFKLSPPVVLKVEGGDKVVPRSRGGAVNRKRHCNVIFCDAIRPLLMTRGQPLDKDELTDGVKQDVDLHRAIAESHNNSDLHNEDAHPHLQNCRGHPKTFAGPMTWEKSKKTLSALVKECDIAFNNWKLSGNHGDFDEPRIPLQNFTQNSNSLLCLHEFVCQHPSVFSKVAAELPKGAFTESSTGVVGMKRKEVTPRKNNAADGWKDFNASNDKRTDAIECALLLKSQDRCASSVQEQRACKRKRLIEQAQEKDTSIGRVKSGHDLCPNGECPSSQDSFCEEISFADAIIEPNREQLKHIKEKLAAAAAKQNDRSSTSPSEKSRSSTSRTSPSEKN